MQEPLSQVQVAEAILGDVSGDSENCLHGDGSSKYHCHLQNFNLQQQVAGNYPLDFRKWLVVMPRKVFHHFQKK